MGLSSNQARFLSLTSRQVDLEHRIQQICQRRLRLSSELENIATSYNNSISNRKMFTPSTAGINSLSMDGLKKLGYRVINSATKTLANAPIKAINQLSESQITAAYNEAHTIRSAADLQTKVNADLAGSFILAGDVDLSSLGPLSSSLVAGSFTGTFDGNGYAISNLNINSTYAGSVGMFEHNSGTIQNVALENANVTDNSTSGNGVGALAGSNGTTGVIKNSYSSGTINGYQRVGGLVGINSGGSSILDSYSTADVNGQNVSIGGLAGVNWTNSTIKGCYATGNVSGGTAGTYVGGLVGSNRSVLENSYSTGNVSGADIVGGLVGTSGVTSGVYGSIVNSYTTSTVTSSGSFVGGFTGNVEGGCSADNSNFYKNNLSSPGSASTAVNGNTTALPTSGWDKTTIWDMSTGLPTFITTGGLSSSKLEEGLRNGTYSLAKEADEYTQDPRDINGDNYQEVDWRSTPEIYDELYKGDDVAAENKYDKTVDEINSQDKKLQLEQTTIEVEYKAVASEKEAVKKILDTNATSSFKYFS